jgi:hypothetical protein
MWKLPSSTPTRHPQHSRATRHTWDGQLAHDLIRLVQCLVAPVVEEVVGGNRRVHVLPLADDTLEACGTALASRVCKGACNWPACTKAQCTGPAQSQCQASTSALASVLQGQHPHPPKLAQL